MPQGISKSKPGASKVVKTTHSAKARSRATIPKSSSRAPKNLKVAQKQQSSRKTQAMLTTGLEKRLAERAGHTEMIAAKEAETARKSRGKNELEKNRKKGGAGAGKGRVQKG